MKATKKALALGLALTMAVTAVPVANVEAAETATLSAKSVSVASGSLVKQSKTITVSTPSTWKNIKLTVKSSNTKVATVKKNDSKKIVRVTAVDKGTAKVTINVDGKKNGKAIKTRKLTATVKVVNSAISLSNTPATVTIGTPTEKPEIKVTPKVAVTTFTSSDEKVATVDALTGAVTGVGGGKATITATTDYGDTDSFEVEVKSTSFQSVTQKAKNKLEATVLGETSKITKDNVKITNNDSKAAVSVKSVAVDANDSTKVIIETFVGMADGKEYSVVIGDDTQTFAATTGTATKIGITATTVPAKTKTKVQLYTADDNDVRLDDFNLGAGTNGKGMVTSTATSAKGYVDGENVYLNEVGATMAVKAVYHSGTFDTSGKETGNIEQEFTIEGVEATAVDSDFKFTISNSVPAWDATSFTANSEIKAGSESKSKAWFYIKAGSNEITDYNLYTVEPADASKVIINGSLSNKSTGIAIEGVSAGDTYILVKKDGKVVKTISVKVSDAPKATSMDITSSVTVMMGRTVPETITATLKDQYTKEIGINVLSTPEFLSGPDGKNAPSFMFTKDSSNPAKANLTVTGATFNGYKKGTYTYSVGAAHDGNSGDKQTRTFSINVVDNIDNDKLKTACSFSLEVPSEINTEVNKDTVSDNNIRSFRIVAMASGAKVEYLDTPGSGEVSGLDVTFKVKDSSGKEYKLANADANTTGVAKLLVRSATSDGKFVKMLGAGQYNVTAEFKNPYMKNTASSGDNRSQVNLYGSFKVVDDQASKVSLVVVKNELNTTISGALTTSKDFMKVIYDGVEVDPAKLVVNPNDVEATISEGTDKIAYVSKVKLYVPVAPDSDKKVFVELPVGQTFTKVTGK